MVMKTGISAHTLSALYSHGCGATVSGAATRSDPRVDRMSAAADLAPGASTYPCRWLLLLGVTAASTNTSHAERIQYADRCVDRVGAISASPRRYGHLTAFGTCSKFATLRPQEPINLKQSNEVAQLKSPDIAASCLETSCG